MNKETIDNLILDNLKYVKGTINKLGLNYNIDDCYGAGLIGLIKACKSYDETKGRSLKSYIITYIRYEIFNYLKAQSFVKRKSNINTVSLDEPISQDNKELTLQDVLDSGIDIEKEYEDNERIKLLHKIILILDERDRYIIEHYYGINGCKKMTQTEIAKELNISTNSVFYHLNKSYGIIRKIMSDK